MNTENTKPERMFSMTWMHYLLPRAPSYDWSSWDSESWGLHFRSFSSWALQNQSGRNVYLFQHIQAYVKRKKKKKKASRRELDSNTPGSKAIEVFLSVTELGSNSLAWYSGYSILCPYLSLNGFFHPEPSFLPTLDHSLSPSSLFLSCFHLEWLSPPPLPFKQTHNHLSRGRCYILHETSLITPPESDLFLQKTSILLLVYTFHRIGIRAHLEMQLIVHRSYFPDQNVTFGRSRSSSIFFAWHNEGTQ